MMTLQLAKLDSAVHTVPKGHAWLDPPSMLSAVLASHNRYITFVALTFALRKLVSFVSCIIFQSVWNLYYILKVYIVVSGEYSLYLLINFAVSSKLNAAFVFSVASLRLSVCCLTNIRCSEYSALGSISSVHLRSFDLVEEQSIQILKLCL